MTLGILGGSGLYQIDALEGVEEINIETPFGTPSDAYLKGSIAGTEVIFLPRHGRGHVLLPSEINYRANIFGFKQLGITQLLSVSAVGSLKEEYRPGDVVLPDQYFDRTKASDRHTFFGNGIVAHIAFAEPVCTQLRAQLADIIAKTRDASTDHDDVRIHDGGTYVNMEGPAFSTKAESFTYRKLGFDIIGMTSLAEAKLAREAEICYACMAMVTDYDCWRDEGEAVSVEMVLDTLRANSALAKETVVQLAEHLEDSDECPCRSALATAIMTQPDRVPEQRKKELEPLIGKYI
jgi:5'-methylthioadenosine phosphorylase